MKTIAVTGATSMIGVALIKECIEKHISVLAFVRANSRNISRIPDSSLVRILECDLSEMESFNVASKYTADVFIHLGWGFTDKNGRNDCEKQLVNIQYTLDAVHLAKRLGCKRFVGTGSQAEYGIPNKLLKSDTPVSPLIPYGVTKYAAGRLSAIECEKEQIEYIWVRVLSIYGKNDNTGTLIHTLVANAKNNIPMGLSGCKQIWDYLFEDDSGAAFLAIAEKGVPGKIYNLGSGDGRPLHEFVEDIIEIVNPGYKPDYGKYPYSPVQPMYLLADITDLKKDTGWEPEISFEDGIKKIIAES
jgi:UDP-glucose 4-epimerase